MALLPVHTLAVVVVAVVVVVVMVVMMMGRTGMCDEAQAVRRPWMARRIRR